ncbi:hypothetical protein J3F82_005755, partial [Coemansia sp. RSA 637]
GDGGDVEVRDEALLPFLGPLPSVFGCAILAPMRLDLLLLLLPCLMETSATCTSAEAAVLINKQKTHTR